MVKITMRLFQRDGWWYVQFRRGIKKSLHTQDDKEAAKKFEELKRAALKGKLLVLDKEPSRPLGEFCKEYLRWSEENQSPNTSERVTRIIDRFADISGRQKLLSSLTSKDLDNHVSFLRKLKNKPSTINIEIRHIKAALSKAVQWKYIKENPFKGFKKVKGDEQDPRFLTVQEISKVFKKIGTNKRWRLIFGLYIYTGGRREEIWKLECRDILADEIYFRWTKNGRPRKVPISDSLEKILKPYRGKVGKLIDITLDRMGRGMKYYLSEAGLKHMKPHDLRHTFASQLIMAGADLVTVKELLGHTSLAATQIYTHLLNEHKKKAIKRLPY